MLTEIWAYRDQAVRGLDMTGFAVETRDGPIGRVDRATDELDASYFVVDADGKRVVLPAGLVDTVDFDSRRVLVDATRSDVRGAPPFAERSGVTPAYRSDLSRYYGGLTSRPAAAGRAAPSRQAQSRQARATAGSAPARKRSRPSRSGRSRRSEEPTKQQLYEQAKRLDIEGRSKMSKAQLAKAVERAKGRSSTRSRGQSTRSRGKANPIEVQRFLEGVGYPAGKRELVSEAKKQRASEEVRSTLERLPNRRFEDPTEVSEAIGNLSR